MSLAALVASLALVLAACGGSAASPSPTDEPEPTASAATSESASAEASASEGETAEDVRVRLESSNFDPAELTISAGTTVVFLNSDSFDHTVTEGTGGQAVDDPIVDREIAGGRTVSVTFDEPGTYDITCKIHPSMQMTITVEG